MPRYRNYYGGYDEHSQRVKRAFDQPLCLTKCKFFEVSRRWLLHISSSTGLGHYEVEFDTRGGTCSCPDFQRRGRPCKHMLCVLLRILKIKDREFHTVGEVGESYEDITPAFLRLFKYNPEEDKPKEDAPSTEEKATATAAGADEEKKESVAEEETEEMCLICLLEFLPNEETISKCTSHCKRWLGHKECLNTWFSKNRLCPLCKGPQKLVKSDVPATKRSRYCYSSYGGDDEVDIEELQAQEDDEGIVQAAPGFFEVLQE